MKFFITSEGEINAVYNDELVDLDIGDMEIKRASTVEYVKRFGWWEARDKDGYLIATGHKRSDVLNIEKDVIEQKLRKL